MFPSLPLFIRNNHRDITLCFDLYDEIEVVNMLPWFLESNRKTLERKFFVFSVAISSLDVFDFVN
jgi:hypothetical protein